MNKTPPSHLHCRLSQPHPTLRRTQGRTGACWRHHQETGVGWESGAPGWICRRHDVPKKEGEGGWIPTHSEITEAVNENCWVNTFPISIAVLKPARLCWHQQGTSPPVKPEQVCEKSKQLRACDIRLLLCLHRGGPEGRQRQHTHTRNG